MKVPFAIPEITNEDIEAVTDALKSGWLSKGPKVTEFEAKIADYLGVSPENVVACNSGTAALHLAVMGLELDAGDEVIVPSYTFSATVNVIEHVGAKPVFADIDSDTLCIDVTKVEQLITSKTKAIIAVHFAGQAADIDSLKKLCVKYDLKFIEDAAHAFGTKYKGKLIGIHGDYICFSFYATKNITTGEGGIVIARNGENISKIRQLCWHGIDRNLWDRYVNAGSWAYSILDHGYKYNMSDVQATLGISQLSRVNKMRERRRELYKRYLNELKKFEKVFSLPMFDSDESENSCHLFIIRFKPDAVISRNSFIEKMKEKGVCLSVHYIPVHMHPYYKKYNAVLPVTEKVFEGCVSLPLCSSLSDEAFEYVVKSINDVIDEA